MTMAAISMADMKLYLNTFETGSEMRVGKWQSQLGSIERLDLGGLSCTVWAITFRRISRDSGGTLDGLVLSRMSPTKPSSR